MLGPEARASGPAEEEGLMEQHKSRAPAQHWHGWGSPVGLGLGLLSVGGFFTLLAVGLSVLASIG